MWANPSRRSSFSAASTVVEKGGGGEALSISIISFPTLFLLFFFPGMIQSQRKAAAQEKDSTYHAREGRERERERKGRPEGEKEGRHVDASTTPAAAAASTASTAAGATHRPTHVRCHFVTGRKGEGTEGRSGGRGRRMEDDGPSPLPHLFLFESCRFGFSTSVTQHTVLSASLLLRSFRSNTVHALS